VLQRCQPGEIRPRVAAGIGPPIGRPAHAPARLGQQLFARQAHRQVGRVGSAESPGYHPPVYIKYLTPFRREFGLERFVPVSLFEGMKRKELRRLISHFLKLNAEMTGSSSKVLTQLQVG